MERVEYLWVTFYFSPPSKWLSSTNDDSEIKEYGTFKEALDAFGRGGWKIADVKKYTTTGRPKGLMCEYCYEVFFQR